MFLQKTMYRVLVQKGMTMAEMLLVILIISVVAIMTISPLIKSYQENQYKIAYKKAYSDMSQAFIQAMQEQTLTPRSGTFDVVATESEWAVLKSAFKVVKECEANNVDVCWDRNTELICGSGSLDPLCNGNGAPVLTSKAFIDISGRAWARYSHTENIYLVDTNGFKNPNKFGQDRWMFTLKDKDNVRVILGFPQKISPYSLIDINYANWICHYPPCYYKSWLYN